MDAFIATLRCPITHQPLECLTQEAVYALNKRVDQGEIKHAHGKQAVKTLVDVLKVRDEDLYYPIVDGIFCLLPHLALYGEFEIKKMMTVTMDEVKQQLQSFYDEVGWQKESSHFVDAVDSEDLRPVSQDYIQKCHARVKAHLPPKGRYLLDVASGPIQYDAYLEYSKGYEYRICADISMQGLRAAQSKLKDKGLYVLCDITQLPFEGNGIDAAVSLHTIYHIPKEQQLKAFQEIYRVLKPQGQMVVIYSWGNKSLLMNLLMLPWKVMSRLRKKAHQRGGGIYFYAFGYRWYQSELKSRFPVELKPWRSVNVPFLKKFIHPYALGKVILKGIYWLEEKCPSMMGRIGAYPLLVFKKP